MFIASRHPEEAKYVTYSLSNGNLFLNYSYSLTLDDAKYVLSIIEEDLDAYLTNQEIEEVNTVAEETGFTLHYILLNNLLPISSTVTPNSATFIIPSSVSVDDVNLFLLYLSENYPNEAKYVTYTLENEVLTLSWSDEISKDYALNGVNVIEEELNKFVTKNIDTHIPVANELVISFVDKEDVKESVVEEDIAESIVEEDKLEREISPIVATKEEDEVVAPVFMPYDIDVELIKAKEKVDSNNSITLYLNPLAINYRDNSFSYGFGFELDYRYKLSNIFYVGLSGGINNYLPIKETEDSIFDAFAVVKVGLNKDFNNGFNLSLGLGGGMNINSGVVGYVDFATNYSFSKNCIFSLKSSFSLSYKNSGKISYSINPIMLGLTYKF